MVADSFLKKRVSLTLRHVSCPEVWFMEKWSMRPHPVVLSSLESGTIWGLGSEST